MYLFRYESLLLAGEGPASVQPMSVTDPATGEASVHIEGGGVVYADVVGKLGPADVRRVLVGSQDATDACASLYPGLADGDAVSDPGIRTFCFSVVDTTTFQPDFDVDLLDRSVDG